MAKQAARSTVPWYGQSLKVAVFGDVMLDEYLWGDVKRISPEAPVPVHRVKSTTYSPGGAANVALNIHFCDCALNLFGQIGSDESGQQLKRSLQEKSLDAEHLFVRSDVPTTKKTRISTGSQQVVRVDFENPLPLNQKDADAIVSKFEPKNFNVVILSDYNKGFLTDYLCEKILEKCAKSKTPVIVDPKAKDLNKYRGAFLITPNYGEACTSLGLNEADKPDSLELARSLVKTYGFENALVTLGARGMVWASRSGGELHLPAVTQEVYDVSGAGDTVLAVMAMSLAAKAPFPEAMSLANFAASRVVQKRGTQPIYLNEFSTYGGDTNKNALNTGAKIVTAEQFLGLNRHGRKVVFTNGCFDLLHIGHVDYLEAARARGDLLVIGLNSDASVQRNKGKSRPIITCEQRARVLAALACVDYVIIFDEDTPLQLITKIVPDVLVKGADWDKNDIVGKDVVEGSGGEVDNIEFTPGVSTTTIIERIHSLPKNLQ